MSQPVAREDGALQIGFRKGAPLEDRYTPEPNTGCWLWLGYNDKKGYGTVGWRVDGRPTFMLAHRWVYQQLVGPIPERMQLCHRCDTPLCVNPSHMFLGTMSDNITDMHRKGRHPWSKHRKTRA